MESTEEEDPRAELVRRLQEYERYKHAAERMDAMPRVDRDVLPVTVEAAATQVVKVQPKVELSELLEALKDVLERAEKFAHHHVALEPLSVRERMSQVLAAARADRYTEFTSLFTLEEGRRGLVVTLLAVLELIKDSLIELTQTRPFGPIHIRAVGE